MGSIIGKENVEEPAYTVLMERPSPPAAAAYEIRQYGTRYGVEISYAPGESDNSPFSALAGYIGVFGAAKNEGSEKIAMTAPVVKTQQQGTKIAMTAPVVKSNEEGGEEKMMFILPAEYDDISKIPKPTDSRIHVKMVPPKAGAVHQFNGVYTDENNKKKAAELASQLQQDGIDLTMEEAMSDFEFWGYNPPFTLPYFRRNEIWIPLQQSQVDQLVSDYSPN